MYVHIFNIYIFLLYIYVHCKYHIISNILGIYFWNHTLNLLYRSLVLHNPRFINSWPSSVERNGNLWINISFISLKVQGGEDSTVGKLSWGSMASPLTQNFGQGMCCGESPLHPQPLTHDFSKSHLKQGTSTIIAPSTILAPEWAFTPSKNYINIYAYMSYIYTCAIAVME